MKTKTLLAFVLLMFMSVTVYSQEQGITKFEKAKFSLGLTTDYKYMLFDEMSEESYFYANKMLDLGLSIGLYGFKINFSYTLPIGYKETPNNNNFSMDLKIDRYGTYSYNYGYLKYNSDFILDDNPAFSMIILNAGLTHEFLFNKEHSLSSVYVLDRRQYVSNGSWVVGGGVFFSSIHSEDIVYEHQYHLYLGPNAGYSYIWILNNNFFLHVLPVVGVNAIMSLGSGFSITDSLSLGLQALPKVAFGYHGNNWSWNIYLHGSYLYAFPGSDKELHLLSGSIGTSFIWRFY
jgi:hypothetical protein